MKRTAFTLLEVMIAMVILTLGLVVLADTQALSVVMTNEADKVRVATLLANEKMAEAQLSMERDGFGEADIDEEGDFKDFGEEEFRGDQPEDLDWNGAFDDFHWAYTVRRIELSIPTDLSAMMGDLGGSGYFPDEVTQQVEQQEKQPDLGDYGISPDMITDMLANYIREVRVLVWWGDNKDGEDQIELVSHVINPSGVVIPGMPGGGTSGNGGAP